jgi:hypothetical protein
MVRLIHKGIGRMRMDIWAEPKNECVFLGVEIGLGGAAYSKD